MFHRKRWHRAFKPRSKSCATVYGQIAEFLQTKRLWISDTLSPEMVMKGFLRFLDQYLGFIKFFLFWIFIKDGDCMSDKKLHYGVRLRRDQLKYLKRVENPSEWVRKAIDEKRKREERRKTKSEWSHLLICVYCDNSHDFSHNRLS